MHGLNKNERRVKVKVFIAGPRAVNELDECVKQKLENICTKQYEVLVGDADGMTVVFKSICNQKIIKM